MIAETKRQNAILVKVVEKSLARLVAEYEEKKAELTEDERAEVEQDIEKKRAALKALKD